MPPPDDPPPPPEDPDSNAPPNDYTEEMPDGVVPPTDCFDATFAVRSVDLTWGANGPNVPVTLSAQLLAAEQGEGSTNRSLFGGNAVASGATDTLTLRNGTIHTVTADTMAVHVYNDHNNGNGAAMGRWWLEVVNAANATLEGYGDNGGSAHDDNVGKNAVVTIEGPTPPQPVLAIAPMATGNPPPGTRLKPCARGFLTPPHDTPSPIEGLPLDPAAKPAV